MPPATPTLDDRDVAILEAMRVYPFNGTPHGPDALRPAGLAQRTGFSIDLVKDRVARMERQGIIVGYQIYPNLHQLGLEETILHITVPLEARDRFFAEVDALEGVVGVSRFVGESACIDLTHASPADRDDKTQALMALAGRDVLPDRYVQIGAKAPTRPLTGLDWRIIQAMRGQAKRPYKHIAEDVGITSRTVRRRLQRMDADGAIDVVVEPDLGAVSGVTLFVVKVLCPPGRHDEVLQRVVKCMRGRSFSFLRPATAELGAFMVDGFAFSSGEIEDIRTEVASVPGVDDVELFFPSSVTASTAWLDDAIAAMVAGAAPPVHEALRSGDRVRVTR